MTNDVKIIKQQSNQYKIDQFQKMDSLVFTQHLIFLMDRYLNIL